MATFAEIIYSVLDLMKESIDDSYYTEEHILFLAKNVRALLLERKYKGSRNSSFNQSSDENLQQICLSVNPTKLLPEGCGGQWLRSDSEVPELLPFYDGVTCTGHDLLFTNVTFIPQERMRYVGYNKWLKNIIYASRSVDGHLYLRSNNPQFMYLEQVGLTGVFADPEAAEKLSHDACTSGGTCDIMDKRFPLESNLVPQLIEIVFQELSGQRYAPEDKKNDAKDGLGELSSPTRGTSPASSVANHRQASEEE